MISIDSIRNSIIERLRSFPEDAKQIRGYEAPKTVWDEYKEQVQFEEYDSFDVLEDAITEIVSDLVNELTVEQIKTIYKSIYEDYTTEDVDEMETDIKDEILSYLRTEAEFEEIEYADSTIKYFKYYMDPRDFSIEEVLDNSVIAICEVLKRVSPYEHLVHAYSAFTGPTGEFGVVDLSSYEEENGLEEIFIEEYNRLMMEFSFHGTA